MVVAGGELDKLEICGLMVVAGGEMYKLEVCCLDFNKCIKNMSLGLVLSLSPHSNLGSHFSTPPIYIYNFQNISREKWP